jgi:hypothetical protein
MSLSSATLSAIQQAGAAVFSADLELKNAVKDYAQRVNAAMVSNPYHLGNDTLFENWKVVARLSQTMAGLEDEIKKVYQVAAELIADDQPLVVQVASLAAPVRANDASVVSQNDMAPTDVLVKSKKKLKSGATRNARAPKPDPSPVKPVGVRKSTQQLSGNPAKLLQYFEKVLNSKKFTVLRQTAAGQETGIPLGSMTAATRKLIESGRVIAGPTGSFRLATAK